MIISNLILFVISFAVLLQSAGYAIRFASMLAKNLHMQEFLVSFFIVAFISILPESTISIISAFSGNPGLGFGTLIGSNVADLSLIIGLVVLFSSKGIKIKSTVLRNNFFYLALLPFPLILGFDGHFSRVDGIILLIVGCMFFARIYMEHSRFRKKFNNESRKPFAKSLILLILSMAVLMISANYTVKFAVNFANDLKLPALLIGLSVIALGTCLPELMFSIRAIKKNRQSLALGDILGNVIIDSTIMLGIVALIAPFSYNPLNVYIIGGSMFLAGIFMTIFMRSGKTLTKLEGLLLILFYVLFLISAFFINFLNGIH